MQPVPEDLLGCHNSLSSAKCEMATPICISKKIYYMPCLQSTNDETDYRNMEAVIQKK